MGCVPGTEPRGALVRDLFFLRWHFDMTQVFLIWEVASISVLMSLRRGSGEMARIYLNSIAFDGSGSPGYLYDLCGICDAEEGTWFYLNSIFQLGLYISHERNGLAPKSIRMCHLLGVYFACPNRADFRHWAPASAVIRPLNKSDFQLRLFDPKRTL